MIFVDASALVAVLAREPGYSEFITVLKGEDRRFYSAMSQWEAIAALCRSHGFALEMARSTVGDFFAQFRFELVSIGAKEADLALGAYEIYGKGRHPASLNRGDCFAYACAKSLGARLVYKGDDFSETDLA